MIFAQFVRNVEFEVQYDSIGQHLIDAFMNKDYKKGEHECNQLIALFKSSSEKIQESYNLLMKDCYYNLACCQSLQNKINEAIHNLELAYQYNYRNYSHVLQDADLDNLRNENRFKAILDNLKEECDYQYILQKATGYEHNLRTDTLPCFSYANPNDSNLVQVRKYFKLDYWSEI